MFFSDPDNHVRSKVCASLDSKVEKPGAIQLTTCHTVSLGAVKYQAAWDIQKRLHQRVVDGALPNVLLLLEHPHVYTLGRRGTEDDILISPERLAMLGAEVHHIDRGGEVTYHGPGQLVGYPIINLRRWNGGALKYVRTLERVLIDTLSEFGIHAESEDRPTGVWVGNAKIAAIGVRISRGVTMHGFALNVDPDLSYFDHIVPCGTRDANVTSMAMELKIPQEVEAVSSALEEKFGRAFGLSMDLRPPASVDMDPSGLRSHKCCPPTASDVSHDKSSEN